jgi:hypothetical protein
MFRASSTSSVLRCVAIAQPTTLRLQASRTTARYRNPVQVGIQVMSATQSRSGPGGREVSIHQIRRGRSAGAAYRRARPLAPADPLQPGRFHQPSHALATHSYALLSQIEVDPWHPVRFSRLLVNPLDPSGQRRIRLAPGRRPSTRPRVVPAGGDSQHPAHHGHLVHGLVCSGDRLGSRQVFEFVKGNQAVYEVSAARL